MGVAVHRHGKSAHDNPLGLRAGQSTRFDRTASVVHSWGFDHGIAKSGALAQSSAQPGRAYRPPLDRRADSPAWQIVKLADLLAPLGPGLVVSDDAVADFAVRPREAEWARFVAACNLLRADRAESA